MKEKQQMNMLRTLQITTCARRVTVCEVTWPEDFFCTLCSFSPI